MSENLTHRRVLNIAVPMVISNATVPLLGLVDTAVVGQMGDPVPIGAVAIGAVLLGSVYWIFSFLRLGITGMTAQAIGRGDRPERIFLLSRGLLIGVLAGLLVVLMQRPIFGGWFAISPASPEVEHLARDYINIRVWSAPAAIAIFAINGWLIAGERSRSVLWLQLWLNCVNIALDVVFVLEFKMGVSGVALATAIAEWSGLAVGLWLCRDAFASKLWRDWARILDREILRDMVAMNSDIFIRSVLLEAIMISFIFVGSGFGDRILAANQVLFLFLNVTAFGLDGFAYAAESLVGQAVGEGSKAKLRRVVYLAAVWGIILSLAMALVFFVFGGMIIDRVTSSPEVRETARTYLPWMVAAPLLGVASWILDGVFTGATQTRPMRNMMTLSFAVYGVSLVILVPFMGNHGLWAAMLIGLSMRGLSLGLCYPALEASIPRNGAGTSR